VSKAPPQSQHQIRLACGCEAPSQAHKAHHQAHEAPTSSKADFTETKVKTGANENSHMPDTLASSGNTSQSYKINNVPKQFAWNILSFMFFGCGILSNTLQIFVFLSFVGFMVMILCVFAANK
jgi:hypothetical protein